MIFLQCDPGSRSEVWVAMGSSIPLRDPRLHYLIITCLRTKHWIDFAPSLPAGLRHPPGSCTNLDYIEMVPDDTKNTQTEMQSSFLRFSRLLSPPHKAPVYHEESRWHAHKRIIICITTTHHTVIVHKYHFTEILNSRMRYLSAQSNLAGLSLTVPSSSRFYLLYLAGRMARTERPGASGPIWAPLSPSEPVSAAQGEPDALGAAHATPASVTSSHCHLFPKLFN